MESKSDKKSQVEIKELKANGLTFQCRVCGLENSGDPIIFLHGFPETSHMWEGIMIDFASKGYRCLAPNQRGYSPGARPRGVKNYLINELASDVVALADAVEFKKFHLVGHDWGAGCGWAVVELYRNRIQSWSALSVPHMAAFDYAKQNDPNQMKQSRYIDLFQVPVIPEMMSSFGNYKMLRKAWHIIPNEEVEDYLTVFGKYSGRKSTINWYRANTNMPIEFRHVSLPTLFIWGNKDLYIGRTGVEMAKQYMAGEYNMVELDAGHWLIQEKFERVRDEILNHIQNHPMND